MSLLTRLRPEYRPPCKGNTHAPLPRICWQTPSGCGPMCSSFLGAYLVIATWHLGVGRALAFVVLGYFISWLAELCSIHCGFPFGEYLYIPATLNQELWVAGVPFMDSLSYVFLAYASYALALVALTPGGWEQEAVYLLRESRHTGIVAPLDPGGGVDGQPWISSSIPWLSGGIVGFWGRFTATPRVGPISASP